MTHHKRYNRAYWRLRLLTSNLHRLASKLADKYVNGYPPEGSPDELTLNRLYRLHQSADLESTEATCRWVLAQDKRGGGVQ